MTEIPKLTADEATYLRYFLLTGGMGTPERIAALAAFDAAERAKIEEALLLELAGDLPGIDPKEDDTATGSEHERREKTMLARHRERIRSQIRVEAMRECENLVYDKIRYSWRGGTHALKAAVADIRAAIDTLIAKETP